MEELKLKDIASELLVLNKITVDKLFQLDNAADCIALYVFYYKTAKWQETNIIKANDLYIKKSLKWGIDKIRRTKAVLKENGLIDIVQRRKDNKIDGWYIQVSYLVTERNLEDVKIKVQDEYLEHLKPITPNSNNTQKQQVGNPTSRNEEINALKETIKSLKKEIEMLQKNNINASKEKANTIEVSTSDIPYEEIVQFLNEAAGTNYRSNSKKTRDLIKSRFNEGFTLEEFKKVIDNKTREWKYNTEMCKYLRPETLFGTKFESYLNQKINFNEESTNDDFEESGYYDWINEAIADYDWLNDDQND